MCCISIWLSVLDAVGGEAVQHQALLEIFRGSDELDKFGYDKAENHFNGEQLTRGTYALVSVFSCARYTVIVLLVKQSILRVC